MEFDRPLYASVLFPFSGRGKTGGRKRGVSEAVGERGERERQGEQERERESLRRGKTEEEEEEWDEVTKAPE